MPIHDKYYSDDVLTLPQASRICGVDFKTVEDWIAQKKLKAFKSAVTGHYQIICRDLVQFLKSGGFVIPESLGVVSKIRILIVDDESNMISAIKRILLDDERYAFETALDGFQAGQKIEKFKPHLVILDIWMPKMDGFKLCASIKKNSKPGTVKILAVSGLVKKEDQRISVDFGADDFLEKPFHNQDLKDKVERLLNIS